MKRFLKLGLAAVLVASAIVATFAFAPAKEEESAKFTTRIFQYVGPRPATITSVVISTNWNLVGATTFVAPPQVIENIQFDDAIYPLTGGNRPNFAIAALKKVVEDHFNQPGDHTLTFSNVTFYFTKQ